MTSETPAISRFEAKLWRESKEPLAARAIVEAALSRGVWTGRGKTPAATVYAAMVRKIAAKGKEARFWKVGRGRFAAGG